MSHSNLEKEIQRIGKTLYSSIQGQSLSLFDKKWWKGQVIEWAMKDELFKTQLFRFVDLLPSLTDDTLVMHSLKEYFTDRDQNLPDALKWGIKGIPRKGFITKLASRTIRKNIESLAYQFIGGEDAESICSTLSTLRTEGVASSIDLLGEVVVSDNEAEQYRQSYLHLLEVLHQAENSWVPNPLLDTDHHGPLPKVHISVKISSLYHTVIALNLFIILAV